MVDPDNLRRRDILKMSGTTLVAGSIAGCSGDGGSDGGSGDGGSDGDSGDGGSDGGSDFPSQNITWVVPYSTGGGFDLIARAYADMWPEYLPNDVDIVVENRTGGGGLTGANYVARADPDGHTIGWWNIPGFIVAQIKGNTDFDHQDISWIARIAEYRFAVMVAPDSDLEPEDFTQSEEPISIASTGQASTSYVFAEILSERLGFEPDHVTGYEGAEEARTAVQRGDTQAYISNAVHGLPFVEDGNLEYLFMISEEPYDFASDVPTVVDMGYEDAYEDIGIHFTVGAPPGVDEERVEILDESLEECTQSDEFMQWAEEADQAVAMNYAGHEETGEIVGGVLDTYQQYSDLFE